MENSAPNGSPLASPSKEFARRLLTIGENRLELLMVEVQEERERLLHAILLALGVALFALLSGAALTIALVVVFWALSPVGVLLTLAVIYAGASIYLYCRFTALQRNWKTFPATLDQFRKDRACFEQHLG